jgi:hypothetical protein
MKNNVELGREEMRGTERALCSVSLRKKKILFAEIMLLTDCKKAYGSGSGEKLRIFTK